MKIRSLAGIPMDYLHRVSNAAYADYVEPADYSLAQLTHMLERRGFRPDLSLGAFDGDDMVGFVCNGSGEWSGLPTAYDTGTAVLPAWRRMGVSTSLFRALLPLLREAGIGQYLLEVIKTNTGAVELYRKSGFEVVREFDYWVCDPGALSLAHRPLPRGVAVKPLDNPDWARLASFWDFPPAWQNSIDAVTRKWAHMQLLGAWHDGEIVAYACMERHSGDVPQFAVHPRFRRRGIATALLLCLVQALQPPEFRVINTDVASGATRSFLQGIGLQPGAGQFEMILRL